MAPRALQNQLIQCDNCGEDYSATEQKCPFCGAPNDARRAFILSDFDPASDPRDEEDDGYIFDGQDLFDDEPENNRHVKGGRRLAAGRNLRLRQVNWPRLITFLCSLVIIIAALIIVFTLIYPRLRDNNGPIGTQSPLPAQTQPAESGDPTQQPSDEADNSVAPTDNGQPSQGMSEPNQPVSVALTGITLNREDFTLQFIGETFQMEAAFTPASWTGTVTWTSSDQRYATVSSTGLVTNVNTSGSLHGVVITATAGGISVECQVYCRSVGATPSTEPPTQPSTEPTPSTQPSTAPSGGDVTVGGQGTITGAGVGLRVRTGPGTSYDVLASLVNGNTISVLADAGNGWYEISFTAGGGETLSGYIMGEYILMD